MNPSDAGGGEQCPQCGEGDLRPYGNGSKWVCARCYFILPCCEGGDLAAQSGCVTGAVPEAAAVPRLRGQFEARHDVQAVGS